MTSVREATEILLRKSSRAAAKHFVDCVHLGRQPVQTPREARAALEVCLAADYSARTGRPVKLPITDAVLE